MEFRRFSSAGLKVTMLSHGAWVSFKAQLGTDMVYNSAFA